MEDGSEGNTRKKNQNKMKELSLHILDLVQNSIQANANSICISINENTETDLFSITITDNGKGMDTKTLELILDPFFTTKGKKTGLGIPLLKQHAELTGGSVSIESQPGQGTKVSARFGYSHIDRQPMGDIIGTIISIVRAYPDIDLEYLHSINNKQISFKTKEIKTELDGVPITTPEVLTFIKEMLNEQLSATN